MRNRSQVHVNRWTMDPSLDIYLTWRKNNLSNNFFLIRMLANAVSVVHQVSFHVTSIWVNADSFSRVSLLNFHSLLYQYVLSNAISVHGIINEISYASITCEGWFLSYNFTNKVLQVQFREISDLVNREVLFKKLKNVIMRSSWIVYQ